MKRAQPRPLSLEVDPGNDDQRLDLFLSRKTGKSRAFVQHQITHDRVTVNGAPATKPSQKIRTGDQVGTLFVEPENFENVVASPGELDILYEDDSLLVLNKAQGVVIHPAAGHRGETLVHHLLFYLEGTPDFPSLSPTRPGIVHRLDRGTSGVLLVAKNRDTLESLSRQFKEREIKKEYEAIAHGVMRASGRFESAIGRDPKERKKMSSRAKEGRESLTLWTRTEAFRHFTHVRLFPHTGRTHQLRVHLSESGHPIVGDDLYGKNSRAKRGLALSPEVESLVSAAKQTYLHAAALHLVHPATGERLTFQAPLPENFQKLLDALRAHDK